MNKLLAEALALLNGLFALLIIILGAVIGGAAAVTEFQYVARSWSLSYDQARLVGIVIGLCLGFVLAVLINGPLALLVHMLQELKGIRAKLADGRASEVPMKSRAEPRIP